MSLFHKLLLVGGAWPFVLLVAAIGLSEHGTRASVKLGIIFRWAALILAIVATGIGIFA